MKFFAPFRIALRALRRNIIRTLLTMLGIIIGVAAVITTVGIGNGAKAQIEAQIATLGQNVILVFSGSMTRSGVHTGWGGAGTLTIEDADAIRREIPSVIGVSPELRSSSQVTAGNQNWVPQILGESPDYFDIRQWPIIDGASFSEQDVRGANKVAVIGKTTAQQLFGSDNPIGQVLRIGVKNVPFTIVGLLSPKGLSMNGSDQDDIVIVPYTSAMKRILGVTTLRSINVQAADAKLLPVVQQQITELLRQRHRIQPGRDDDFTVRGQQDIAEMATAQSKTMGMLLAAVALVSLIVGGIGIMNIMLVSVTERTREIGIRMAVGARSGDVLLQFLIEAVTLSLIGGLIGISLGIAASKGVQLWMLWPIKIPIPWMVVAFLSSAVIGIAFGFYPAWKASRLDPIDALRYE
jgi:putative ABC transport system permease protein